MNKQDRTAIINLSNMLTNLRTQHMNAMTAAREERMAHDPGTKGYEEAQQEVLSHAKAYDRACMALSTLGLTQYMLQVRSNPVELSESVDRLINQGY